MPNDDTPARWLRLIKRPRSKPNLAIALSAAIIGLYLMLAAIWYSNTKSRWPFPYAVPVFAGVGYGLCLMALRRAPPGMKVVAATVLAWATLLLVLEIAWFASLYR